MFFASLTALNVSHAIAQQTDAEATMQDVERIVSLDLVAVACSNRMTIEGFRFDRVQKSWRAALVKGGTQLLGIYEKRRAVATEALLRVMRDDEKKACPYAALRNKDFFTDSENPILEIREATP